MFTIEKWPVLVLWIVWTHNYQLLDVLRNADRILVEQRPFQLQQAFHDLWFCLNIAPKASILH